MTTSTQKEEAEKTSEPKAMTWYAFAFMVACLLMTSALVYYVWQVFAQNAL